jgi:hypothetical protein
MEQGRSGDLVLAQGTYVHILEGATGQVLENIFDEIKNIKD